jgi:hypothetical protein
MRAAAAGRICIIDAVLLPVLSLIGLLNVFHVLSFSWNGYVNALAIIVVASFIPEFFGLTYMGRRGT